MYVVGFVSGLKGEEDLFGCVSVGVLDFCEEGFGSIVVVDDS